MKVVVLCGGQGTRLREETEFRPKPLVEVGGRPILWHIMKGYAHYGFQRFVLCLGYRGNMIKEYFLNYDAMNNDFSICLGHGNQIVPHGRHEEHAYEVTLVDTGIDSMTGARIKRVQPYLDGDCFMATYGDGLSDINIRSLIDYHNSHGRLATVSTVRPVSRYGIVGVERDGVVSNFVEKPQIDGWASAGFFVFKRQVLDYLSADPSCVLEQEPLQRLAKDGELMAYRHEGFFYAMDTYRELLNLNAWWTTGAAPWAKWRDNCADKSGA
jgi:glucose-1-phosphate cytidylyltransferase